MNEFTERYQKMSELDLIEIISNAEDYQPLALETAKKEIENRGLSEKELIQAYSQLELKRQGEQQKVEIRKEKEEQLKSSFFKFVDPINPFKQSIPSYERTIRLIVIVFGFISVYQLVNGFEDVVYIITPGNGSWDYNVLLFLASYFLLPVATVLFWKRKKTGWILLLIYLIFSLINIIFFIILTFQYSSFQNQPSDFLIIEDLLFPPISPTAFILPFLFYIGTIWVMFMKDLRAHFFNKKLNTHENL